MSGIKELLNELKTDTKQQDKSLAEESRCTESMDQPCIYEITYDTDTANNLVEEFEGSWLELQDYIQQMKENDCYNINASCVYDPEDSLEECDKTPLTEASSDEISNWDEVMSDINSYCNKSVRGELLYYDADENVGTVDFYCDDEYLGEWDIYFDEATEIPYISTLAAEIDAAASGDSLAECDKNKGIAPVEDKSYVAENDNKLDDDTVLNMLRAIMAGDIGKAREIGEEALKDKQVETESVDAPEVVSSFVNIEENSNFATRIAQAVRSEQSAIAEYETLLNSSDISESDKSVIQKIVEEEKNHLVAVSSLSYNASILNNSDNVDEANEEFGLNITESKSTVTEGGVISGASIMNKLAAIVGEYVANDGKDLVDTIEKLTHQPVTDFKHVGNYVFSCKVNDFPVKIYTNPTGYEDDDEYIVVTDVDQDKWTIPESNSVITEAAKPNASQIASEVRKAVNSFMMSPQCGFDEKECEEYSVVETSESLDGRLRVEVRAELSYDSMWDLSEILNKLIQKYDKDAYFDMEEAGIMSAYISR